MNPDLIKILSGPHKFVNGTYVSALPTQDEINEAINYAASRGYSPEAATKIVAEHGPEVVLASKAEDVKEKEVEKQKKGK